MWHTNTTSQERHCGDAFIVVSEEMKEEVINKRGRR
jgi:hypothetical protein